MKKIFALALAALALSATPAFAQANKTDEAFMENAWADGVLDAREKAEFVRIEYRGALAAAADAAKTKITPKMMGKTYSGEIGYVDQKASPWKPATAALWNTEAQLPRANWSTSSAADYDGDGKPDIAVIMTNGKQTAVLLRRSTSLQPLVIFKTDGIAHGAQIYAAGKRFLLSIPDHSPIILFSNKGKPAAAFLGD